MSLAPSLPKYPHLTFPWSGGGIGDVAWIVWRAAVRARPLMLRTMTPWAWLGLLDGVDYMKHSRRVLVAAGKRVAG